MAVAGVVAALGAISQGVDVADKAGPILWKAREAVVAMKSDHTLIINEDPNPNHVVEFYVYNTIAPIKMTTQFRFPSKQGTINEVYCPAMGTGWKGMKVFIDNKQPGWGIQRGQVYVFDGNSFNPLLSKEKFLEKTKNLDPKFKIAAAEVKVQTQTVPQVAARPKGGKAGGAKLAKTIVQRNVPISKPVPKKAKTGGSISKSAAVKPKKSKTNAARMEYGDYYGDYNDYNDYNDYSDYNGDYYGYDAFDNADMAPYVQQSVAEGYTQHDTYPQLPSQAYGQYDSQWMGAELMLAGVVGIILLALCALVACVCGGIAGATMQRILSSTKTPKIQRYGVDHEEEEV